MQQNTFIESTKLQCKSEGFLRIQDAKNIHSLIIQHNQDSSLSISIDDVISYKELDIFLSNCNTTPLSFEYNISNAGDESKVLTISVYLKAFHITINGKFQDINLEVQPKVNKTQWHAWNDH
ncbi:MAG: hypothetical protein H7196_04195 [candidate division SR1 bacterium]|nr:hypothetical protein [candidate division SR1 bacterium]